MPIIAHTGFVAHDNLAECIQGDTVAGRAGLVGTQNIRNNEAREGGLDYVTATGTIVEAVESQPWSGEANVHVSIVNWIKSRDPACPFKKELVVEGGSCCRYGARTTTWNTSG